MLISGISELWINLRVRRHVVIRSDLWTSVKGNHFVADLFKGRGLSVQTCQVRRTCKSRLV